MRVYLLAKKLKVKSSDIVEKLALLKINVAPSSKIDSFTAAKAKVLVKSPLRVEEVASELDLPVDKLLKKLSRTNIEVISHLSVLQEADLIHILKLKSLEKLKGRPIVKKGDPKKVELKVLKLKPKKKRVFEIAAEMGVSEIALLKQLREMNVLALHRRSPLDDDMIEQLKSKQYRFIDKLIFRFQHFFEEIPEYLRQASHLASNTAFYVVVIVLLVIFGFSNALVIRQKFIKQKTWVVQGGGLTKSMESYQVLETIGLLEIKDLGLKFPIIEEGKENSPINAVLVHKSATVTPGSEGSSLLEDKQGSVSQKLEAIKAGQIITVTNLEGDTYYFRLVDEKQIKTSKKPGLKSTMNIMLTKGRKLVAVLQKIE